MDNYISMACEAFKKKIWMDGLYWKKKVWFIDAVRRQSKLHTYSIIDKCKKH